MAQSNVQEAYYDADVDYRHGSPHLTDLRLHDMLVERLRDCLKAVASRGLPLRVLEIGAGHGGFTESALALGAEVTAVDMSEPAVAELERRFGTNPRFTAIHDADGSMAHAGDDYSLLLGVAVLHHIPDYLAFLNDSVRRLRTGGAVLTMQDPLWYPRHLAAYRFNRVSYYLWRSLQGDLGQGLATAGRRFRGIYDETKPGDMVEYHVNRQGVDEEAIARQLAVSFEDVDIYRYWSNQLYVSQKLGSWLKAENTFGIEAHGFSGRT